MADVSVLEKVTRVVARFNELSELMADPQVISDQGRLTVEANDDIVAINEAGETESQ